jgi:hypothetical protein
MPDGPRRLAAATWHLRLHPTPPGAHAPPPAVAATAHSHLHAPGERSTRALQGCAAAPTGAAARAPAAALGRLRPAQAAGPAHSAGAGPIPGPGPGASTAPGRMEDGVGAAQAGQEGAGEKTQPHLVASDFLSPHRGPGPAVPTFLILLNWSLPQATGLMWDRGKL